MYTDYNSSARFQEKVKKVAESLGTEGSIGKVGVVDLPEQIVGLYSPENGNIALNAKYASTALEDIAAGHEAIHSLQMDKIAEYDLKPEQEKIYETLVEAQASRYTPGDTSYPELQGIYDDFMNTFTNYDCENYGMYKKSFSVGDDIRVNVIYRGEKEDFEELVDVYFPYGNEDIEELVSYDEYNEVASILKECEKEIQNSGLPEIMEYDFKNIDDEYEELDNFSHLDKIA